MTIQTQQKLELIKRHYNETYYFRRRDMYNILYRVKKSNEKTIMTRHFYLVEKDQRKRKKERKKR